MEQEFTVSFFGHRIINDWDAVEKALERVIRHIIENHNGVTFLVGRDGDFDHLVTSTIRRLRQKTDCCDLSLVWVQPYPKAEYYRDSEAFDEYYDAVEVCDKSASAHPKAAYGIRNQEMIDCSDLVVFYVESSVGGAHRALQYSDERGKQVINIAENKNAKY